MQRLFPALLRRAGILPRAEPEASPPPVLAVGAYVHAGSIAEKTPTQGLILVEYEARAAVAGSVTLQIWTPGADRPAFERSLEVAPDSPTAWVAVHGHLLPNGPVTLGFRLVGDGSTLSEVTVTLQVRNEGPTARAVAASLAAKRTPLVVEVCDGRDYDYADPSLAAWFDKGPEAVEAHLADLAARGAANEAEIAALRQFVEEGYLLLPTRLDAELLERLNAAVDDAVAKKIEGYEWGESQRLHNLHRLYPAIHELWLHPAILRMLSLIFEEPAKPWQSLTYVFGSEQQFHQDFIHLTPFPAGRMCGVWAALEDVQPESGELIVYPGSHRLNRIFMADAGIPKIKTDWTAFGETVAKRWESMIVSNGLSPIPYRPKAGEVLIWHDNLMHGGMVRGDRGKSRRSIVGHYFANGAIAYDDSAGTPGHLHETAAG